MKKIYKLLTVGFITTAIQSVNAQCPVPGPVTASPAAVCAGATTSLNATAVGAAINWFTVPVGGSPIGSSLSGANYPVTPVNTTTYYAESFVAGTTTLNFTGALQNFTVPAGVTTLTVDLRGAKGGTSYPTSSQVQGGNGGRVTGTITVTPGQVLQIYVGGIGGNGTNNSGGTGGFNGGGTGQPVIGAYAGGGGGGASDIRVSPYGLADRVAVAGGGGGGGYDCNNELGGLGGGLTAGDGSRCGGNVGVGLGGTQIGGGGATNYPGYCMGSTGALGVGGNAGVCSNAGGGGGGGYYGGGGGAWGSGGGGSSFLVNGVHTQAFQAGPGSVILSYNGCTSISRTAIVVTVNPNPTITVNSGSICLGNSFTMVPSGANTYTFQGGNAVVSPTVNTNYTVVGTSSAGCVSQAVTSSITINASPLPTITVNSGSICAGQSFTIVPSGANTYTFQGGNAVVSPTATAAYTVIGTNTAGCVSGTFATSNVTVNALPNVWVFVGGTGTICVGESATLTANGANSYSWNTGASTTTIVVSPTVTTSYTAVGTSSTGCSNSGVMSVVVSPCTGVANNPAALSGLSVYPNPSNGDFTVELKNGLTKSITIVDYTGKVVLNTTTSKDVINISLAAFANGIYSVKIESNNALQTIKVVKQ